MKLLLFTSLMALANVAVGIQINESQKQAKKPTSYLLEGKFSMRLPAKLGKPAPPPSPLPGSKFISYKDATGISKMFGKGTKFKLLYSAAKDGWSPRNFGSKVYGKGKTITIIKTTGGQILGGYTNIKLKSSGYRERIGGRKDSFMFYLKNGAAHKSKHNCRYSEINFSSRFLLDFNYGLRLGNNANKYYNSKVYIDYDWCYKKVPGTSYPKQTALKFASKNIRNYGSNRSP